MIELKSEMDRLLSRLGGVIAARAIFNADDEIEEIHVLSDLTKSPKQLVRDIQSATMAAFGLDVDYKLISIAQVDSDMVTPPSITVQPRLSIRKITIGFDSQSLEAMVSLSFGDKSFEGSSKGSLSARSRISATATATVQALNKYFAPASSVSLVEFQRQTIAGSECFTVALSFSDGVRDSVRFGIAPISGPETEVQAIVRAILSAVNRSVGFSDKTGA